MTEGQIEPAIETLAAVTAAIEEGAELEAACAAHGVPVGRYTAAKDRLLADLATHAERGDLRSSRAWTRAFAAAQRAARAAARKEKRKPPAGPSPVAPGPVVVPVITPLAPAVPAATSLAATPPPLQGRSADASAAPWSEQPRTAPQPPVVHAPATPFAPRPTPPPFVAPPPFGPAFATPPPVAPPAFAPPPVAPPTGARKLSSTMMHAGPLLPTTPLPFQTAARSAAPTTPAGARPPSEPPVASRPAPGTMVADISQVLAAVGAPLPFAGHAPPPPPATPMPRRGPSALSTTQPPSVGAGAALPFQNAASGRPAEPARPATGSHPATPEVLDAAARSRAESFTLAQYARLCAELRADPDAAPRVRASYGVDGPAWAHMHTLWQGRFKDDPTLRFRWEKQVEQILAKLRSGA